MLLCMIFRFQIMFWKIFIGGNSYAIDIFSVGIVNIFNLRGFGVKLITVTALGLLYSFDLYMP